VGEKQAEHGCRLHPCAGAQVIFQVSLSLSLSDAASSPLPSLLVTIGRYSEITEEEKKDWAHKVNDKNGMPIYEVEYKGEVQRFTPEEVTAVMLRKMKETTESESLSPSSCSCSFLFGSADCPCLPLFASSLCAAVYLGVTVKEVALSVPLRATEEYKKALIDSADKAGLKVTALVKEPVASLLSFGIGQSPEQFFVDRNILVFDLGGNFLDITLVASFGGLYEILYSSSEKMGGKAYDQKLTEHFAKEFERKNKAEIRSNAKALSKLRFVAENTRRTLSNSPAAQISVESLHDGVDFHSSINRSMFDMVTGPLNRGSLAAIQKGLDASNLTPADIQEVILVGGGTSMLGVQKMIEAFFPDSTIRKDVAPEEYVACGVAFEGKTPRLSCFAYRRALPHSLLSCQPPFSPIAVRASMTNLRRRRSLAPLECPTARVTWFPC